MINVSSRVSDDQFDFNRDDAHGDPHGAMLRRIPMRVRGEAFDQKKRFTYSFKCVELVANLFSVHSERGIVVQFDVSRYWSMHEDFPVLSREKVQFSEQLLRTLRSRCIGWRSVFARVVRGQVNPFQIEGPFVPRQSGLALMTLIIQVSRDGNYDQAHNSIRKFLELHRDNDDRARYLKHWKPSKRNRAVGKQSDVCDQYCWSDEELRAVERMARLEGERGSAQEEEFEARLRYNEDVIRSAQSPKQSRPTVGVADHALKRFFSSAIE